MKQFLFRRKIRRVAGISLIPVFLISIVLLQPRPASAAETASSVINLNVVNSIAIRILDSAGTTEINNVPLSLTAAPGGSFASADFNVDVSVSAADGYTLFMSSSYTLPSSTTYSTDLVNQTENSYVIPTLGSAVSATDFATGASDSTNKWGYSVDDTTYNPIPAHGSAEQIDTYSQATSSRLTPVNIGLFVNLDKPSGTYKNQLTFSAVANPVVTEYALYFEPGTTDTVTDLPDTMAVTETSAQHTFTLPSTAPSRSGHTFSGYLDEATGITYQAGDSFTIESEEDFTGTATLVAQWDIDQYTVTINTSSVTAGTSSLTVNYGGSAVVKVTPSSGYYLYRVTCPSGYTCTGYNTGEEYTSQQTIIVTNDNTASGGTLVASGSLVETMQNPENIAICKNSSVGTSMDLRDSRTNRPYTVTKLADGNCWMTDSLRLSGGRTLTSEDSDVTSDYYFKTTKNTEGDTDWCNTSSEACVNMANSSNVPGTHSGDSEYGFYYTWAAATAGTGTYSTTSGTASSSLCPKGWRLPTMAEYATLYSNYSSISALTSDPVNISTGGYTGMYGSDAAAYIYNLDTSSVNNIYYWSSTASSASEASALITKNGVINTSDPSFAKYNGAQIRCIAK